MKKPLIGVVPLIDYQKNSYWMLPGYMKAVEEAGGIPLMVPLTQNHATIAGLIDTLDGFMFTGGQDVDPALYGMPAVPEMEEISPERDAMEKILFEEILKCDMPLFGICRGLQLINVLLGGTLYQDLTTQHPSDVTHRQPAPYDKPSHDVFINDGTLLSDILKKERVAVNSCHHQAVRTLATSLKAAATSPDGITEAAYMPDKHFVLAVQWHPEFMYTSDENSKLLFEAFVKAC